MNRTAKEMDLFANNAKMTQSKRTVVEFDTNELRKITMAKRNADRWKQNDDHLVRMANLCQVRQKHNIIITNTQITTNIYTN